MTVQRLIQCFSRHQKVVEVQDVRDQILEWGYYDGVVISPFDDDPELLLGTMVNFTTLRPYGVEKEYYVVRYNINSSIPMQRLICVKELVHSLDPVRLRVSSKAQLSVMLNEMLNKGGAVAELSATALFEDVAIYQALAIICPEDVREELYVGYHANPRTVTLDDVAARFRIPLEYAGYLMSPGWLAFRNQLAGIETENNA